jgi:hypothetical protein
VVLLGFIDVMVIVFFLTYLTLSAAVQLTGGGDMSLLIYESMKRKLSKPLYESVGVMEDYKLRDLRAWHTLDI